MIDEQQYQVEKILAAKFSTKTNRVYYLVKWLNWDLTTSTWQPEQHLQNSIQSINQYKSNLTNSANTFNWKEYKEFRQFWLQQDTWSKIPKKRGRKKKQSNQSKQKIQKKNKKITKKHQFIKINSKEEESYQPEQSRQLTLSHHQFYSQAQKDIQKISRKSEPTKTMREKQPEIKQKILKIPRNHILLDQSQKYLKKNEQNQKMCEQRQNNPQNQQNLDMIQKKTENQLIQKQKLKKQEKNNKNEVFSKKICDLINNNVQIISQVFNGMVKNGSQCKKKQQQQMQNQSEQAHEQDLNMKQNQKQLEGQEADDQFSSISSKQRSIEVQEIKKTTISDKNMKQNISNRFQYKVLGIKREGQNVTNVTNVVQLKYKLLNTETNEKYWENKQFVLKNCPAQLIQFYENNLDWKNKADKWKNQ